MFIICWFELLLGDEDTVIKTWYSHKPQAWRPAKEIDSGNRSTNSSPWECQELTRVTWEAGHGERNSLDPVTLSYCLVLSLSVYIHTHTHAHILTLCCCISVDAFSVFCVFHTHSFSTPAKQCQTKVETMCISGDTVTSCAWRESATGSQVPMDN